MLVYYTNKQVNIIHSFFHNLLPNVNQSTIKIHQLLKYKKEKLKILIC